eukprot:CAMPEP_0174303662 /NCGR_PEP_ID=MMETSP0809-20121228/60316_1 /TAXON_ID=73025 ORGANISM="Eutreptiella gymnastica-like, Strain CCMP1594" /NCGR_SAMPLE_ID=MMETSP0809 /ASSEMBLY_ACC=CAM_ASM_000658 /LENGTH=60 /DNA_ID=CAMNT_0015409725 /DNA_START=354 /DNA_END=536 /DNA_ORIENTATION=-
MDDEKLSGGGAQMTEIEIYVAMDAEIALETEFCEQPFKKELDGNDASGNFGKSVRIAFLQ